jgi:hypothetical protein
MNEGNIQFLRYDTTIHMPVRTCTSVAYSFVGHEGGVTYTYSARILCCSANLGSPPAAIKCRLATCLQPVKSQVGTGGAAPVGIPPGIEAVSRPCPSPREVWSISESVTVGAGAEVEEESTITAVRQACLSLSLSSSRFLFQCMERGEAKEETYTLALQSHLCL